MGEEQTARPMISVIIPIFNGERYVAEAIESVLSQTYPSLELLLIDDCSTDRSAQIACQYEERDCRVHFYQNAKNCGVAETRNFGITKAQGDWVALLDSDDIWWADKLERQLEVADKTGAELIYTSYAILDADGGRTKDYMVPDHVTYKAMLRENVIGCSTVLARRDLLQKHDFRSDYYHEDYLLWLELLREGHSFAGCREVLTGWRKLPSSRSADKIWAARKRWDIYRKAEKLPLLMACHAFAAYVFHGVKKSI